jgi:uncharacterized membrane protein YfhO
MGFKAINDFDLNVTANEPAVLVISQIGYPGWKATVDDKAASITRANYALPSIFVPAGTHRVHFSFAPLSFRVGLLLSAISVCIVAGCLFRQRAILSSSLCPTVSKG